MSLLYRAAALEDAGALAAFWRDRFDETFGHTYAPADLAAFLAASYGGAQQGAEIAAPGMAHRLCLQGEAIMGACQIGPLTLPIDAGADAVIELKRLYLSTAVQGQGIAQALMDWALVEAKARGARRMYLGVWRHNARAQRFYAKNGFAKVGEYLFPVGETLDEEDILARAM